MNLNISSVSKNNIRFGADKARQVVLWDFYACDAQYWIKWLSCCYIARQRFKINSLSLHFNIILSTLWTINFSAEKREVLVCFHLESLLQNKRKDLKLHIKWITFATERGETLTMGTKSAANVQKVVKFVMASINHRLLIRLGQFYCCQLATGSQMYFLFAFPTIFCFLKLL